MMTNQRSRRTRGRQRVRGEQGAGAAAGGRGHQRRRLELVEDLFAPELAEPARQAFRSFRAAFPHWREEIVDLVAEGDKVAARFRCSGTFQGEFMVLPPTGRRQEVDEVFFLRVREVASWSTGGWRTT